MTIHELIAINNQLKMVLNEITHNNRGESIQSINELLRDRETVFKQLDFNSLKSDPLVKQLQADETEIRTKMENTLNEIKKDLQMVSKKKSKGSTYINPYKNLYVNGAFIDKKK